MDQDVCDDVARHLLNEPNRQADAIAPPTPNIAATRKSRGGPQASGLPDLGLSEAASAPIHLLPPELLIGVFRFYSGMNTPVRNLGILTLVCKLWRNIVEDTPSLWCFISGREGLPGVRKALAMAKDTPLEINYEENASKTDPRIFFAEIMGRIAHWKSMIVVARILSPAIFVFQTMTAPNLTTLHLYTHWGERWTRKTVTLFGGEPASTALKDFRVERIPVAIDPLRLSGLRSLDLDEMPIISAEEVLRVLRDSPALERCYLTGLVLKDFTLSGREQKLLTLQPVGGPNIQLLRLRGLALGSFPVSFIHVILSTIRAPSLQCLFVDCKIDQPGTSLASALFTDHISHLTPALRAISSTAKNIEITSLSDDAWSLHLPRLIIRLRGPSLQPKHADETVDWLFGHLGEHLEALPVSLSFHEVDVSSDWFISMASTLKVTTLELTTNDPYFGPKPKRQPRKIISLLSRPFSFAPTQWLLPDLETIDTNVVNRDGKFEIFEMVNARHSFIGEQAPGTMSSLKPFKEIRLAGGWNGVGGEADLNRKFLNALYKVKRGAEISWGGFRWPGNRHPTIVDEFEYNG